MKVITLRRDMLRFSDIIASTARGYYHEPKTNFGRRMLEKKEVLSRRLILPTDPPLENLPMMTMSDYFPDQMFFYGTPEAYVNNCRYYQNEPETIRGVANHDIRYGLIWYSRPPLRHHHFAQIQYEYGYRAWDRAESLQGFMTSHGRWLNRLDAMALAASNGQLKDRPGVIVQEKLYSENLW
ncbi:MAG: hypothetical protein P4L77_10595 [Sulfuriferula sp.]|nr:hypothetical protein [Sulfuriferula sp.]